MPDPRLIVGIGNPERSDAGLGWRVASQIAAEAGFDKVATHTVFELTADAAEPVARSSRVLFIMMDPAAQPGEIHFGKLQRDASLPHDQIPHQLTPARVLELAYRRHSAEPEGWLLTVGGKSIERGEDVSAPVKKVWPALLERARQWVKAL